MLDYDSIGIALERRGNMPLALAGWDDYSVWGWDDGCLYAQLWQNTDNCREAPRVWIAPGSRWPSTASPCVLAEYVSMGTGCTIREAVDAMASSAPEIVKEALAATMGA